MQPVLHSISLRAADSKEFERLVRRIPRVDGCACAANALEAFKMFAEERKSRIQLRSVNDRVPGMAKSVRSIGKPPVVAEESDSGFEMRDEKRQAMAWRHKHLGASKDSLYSSSYVPKAKLRKERIFSAKSSITRKEPVAHDCSISQISALKNESVPHSCIHSKSSNINNGLKNPKKKPESTKKTKQEAKKTSEKSSKDVETTSIESTFELRNEIHQARTWRQIHLRSSDDDGISKSTTPISGRSMKMKNSKASAKSKKVKPCNCMQSNCTCDLPKKTPESKRCIICGDPLIIVPTHITGNDDEQICCKCKSQIQIESNPSAVVEKESNNSSKPQKWHRTLKKSDECYNMDYDRNPSVILGSSEKLGSKRTIGIQYRIGKKANLSELLFQNPTGTNMASGPDKPMRWDSSISDAGKPSELLYVKSWFHRHMPSSGSVVSSDKDTPFVRDQVVKPPPSEESEESQYGVHTDIYYTRSWFRKHMPSASDLRSTRKRVNKSTEFYQVPKRTSRIGIPNKRDHDLETIFEAEVYPDATTEREELVDSEEAVESRTEDFYTRSWFKKHMPNSADDLEQLSFVELNAEPETLIASTLLSRSTSVGEVDSSASDTHKRSEAYVARLWYKKNMRDQSNA